jgi:hypothetical protein
MAAVVLPWLWFVTLPIILWLAVRRKGGLHLQWTVLPISYALMQVLLIASYTSLDWGKRSSQVRESLNKSVMQAFKEANVLTEETALLAATM